MGATLCGSAGEWLSATALSNATSVRRAVTGAVCGLAGRDQGVDVLVQHALSRAPPLAPMRALRSAAKSWSGS